MAHWIKALFRFLDQLHVFVVPSYRRGMCRCQVWVFSLCLIRSRHGTAPLSLPETNKWCHIIADVLVIWRSAPHMTIHWRPSRTHQRRGVLNFNVLSLKVLCSCCLEVLDTLYGQAKQLAWGHLRSGEWIWMLLFSTSEKVYEDVSSQGVPDPFEMFLDFFRCSMHCCVLHFRLWLKQFHAFAHMASSDIQEPPAMCKE